MKKILSIVTVTVLAVFIATTVFATSFKDVKDSDYYAEAAERMVKRGILSGYGDGMYHGNEPVTRAHIAALVCKMLGKAKEAEKLAGETVFTDVNLDAWYTGYINFAVSEGIINGDGDGKFRPDDNVKFEEVVKVVVCVLDLDGGIKIDPADWSKGYIAAAEKAGLMKNLIGKKGEPMLRSDIAVICDAGMTVLDAASEDTTTTKRGVSKPAHASTTAPESTDAPSIFTTYENALPPIKF